MAEHLLFLQELSISGIKKVKAVQAFPQTICYISNTNVICNMDCVRFGDRS